MAQEHLGKTISRHHHDDDTEVAHDIENDTTGGSTTSTSVEKEEKLSTSGVGQLPLNNDNGKPTHNGSTSSIEKDGATTAGVAAPTPEEPEASRTTFQTFVIMSSLCASVFLAALDMSIITTALPTIAQHFNSSSGYTWIGSSYLLAVAVATPSWGKFSDIWGRKPILLGAAIIFFVGSALCGAAVNIGMLIAARAIQGVGGGGLIILVNISISDLFSMRNRSTYYGIIGMVWAFAGSIGPVLGGVFTEQISWRWCFYINLPITGATFILLYFYLHLHSPKTPVIQGLKAVDWTGSALVGGGTLMLLLGLEFGGVVHPWGSATVICLIVFGIVVAAAFFVVERNFAKYPIMPLRLFKSPSNIAAFSVCFCHGYVFIAGIYYLPLYFQSVLGATPLMSGVYLLPFAVSLSLVSAASGVYIKKTGKYLPPIYFGLIVMTLGFGLLIDLPGDKVWAKIIIYEMIAGIGCGPNFQSPLIALQNGIAKRDIAAATATFGFVRNLSTAISVVIGGVVFQNRMQLQSSSLVGSLGPEEAAALSGGSAGTSVELVNSLQDPQRQIARDAYRSSLRVMWIMYVAFGALGILASLFIKTSVLSREHELTKTGLAEEEAKRVEEAERRKAKAAGRKASAGKEKGVKEEA